MTNNGDLRDINSPPVEGVGGGGTAYGWIDGDSHCSSSCKGYKDSSELPSSDMMHAWFMPSTATVGSQEIPRPLEPITLLAARNERECVQIAVRPKVSWGGPANAGSVQIHCTDLCSISGARLLVGESLILRCVVPVLGFPDALLPLELPTSQINLIPGETTAIWLSIVVPSTQPPGRYDGDILLTAIKADTDSVAHRFGRSERCQLYSELRDCLDVVEATDGRSQVEMDAIINSTRISLKKILTSSSFSEFYLMNAPTDMEEDARSNFSICLKLSLTVWDFVLPATPSLPAIFGISDTVIEDRFGVERGSDEWFEAFELHFKWFLQYRISPYFCRWGESMRVLTYTCPWPADHPKSDEYFSDPRLAAYAVPYNKILSRSEDEEAGYLQKQVNILRRKEHWKKAYFYLWDEPLNMEQYDSLRHMASEIHAYAPDARILTTYYCGPNDAPLAPSTFESFLKVPKFLRPHTQIYCTSEWVLGNREDLVKDIVSEIQIDHGEEWWSYICMGPSDPHPNWHLGMRGTQHRAVMWRVWKEGCTGFLYWGANCYEKATVPSAEIKFRRGLPPGDGVLFYPGQVFSHLHPVASVRLERLLSGLQDIEYLRLYESRYGRNEAMSLLERTGVYLGPERYTQEHGPIDVMRSEIFSACRC